ncbi:DoxX family protein [Listeria booriae]|uniref:DoxX family protein n=2 Tax=Listeria booriae TaxID=1552123 RepID=A0A7X0TPY6_9LIST|nr:DoxX family protein [Listeria booriae]MBC1231340.1 DoxX family protein [Listeria booriae]MBC1291593.1 DoxX family protein [Listeria booriae]MBC1332195.1 DoxX family protein [Listeria booriae]MBC1372702.1 DoxX family protein [Listeria booriae]
MNLFLQTKEFCKMNKYGILIVRILLGGLMFLHGLQKFTNGIGGTVQFFESLGIPGFMGYVVASIELVGGLALAFGVLVPYVSALFIGILGVAIVTVKLSDGFLGGFEPEFVLVVLAVVTLITSPLKKVFQFMPSDK